MDEIECYMAMSSPRIHLAAIRSAYPIKSGVPYLLPSEARHLD